VRKERPQPFFIPLPWDFFEAWLVDARVKPIHVLGAHYIAARCFEARTTGGGIAPVELSTVACLCGVSTETIRRKLHDLREWGGVDLQAGDGADPAWRIWLTGLSLDETSPRPLHDLSTNTPHRVEKSLHDRSEGGWCKPAWRKRKNLHDLSTEHFRRTP
jgi:hypothetical protein